MAKRKLLEEFELKAAGDVLLDLNLKSVEKLYQLISNQQKKKLIATTNF